MAFCGAPFPWCFLGAESERFTPASVKRRKSPLQCSNAAVFLAPTSCSEHFTRIALTLQFRGCFLLTLKEQGFKNYPERSMTGSFWELFKVSLKQGEKKLVWTLARVVFDFWDNSCSFPTFLATVLICPSWACNFYFVKYKMMFSHYLYDRHLLGVKQTWRKGPGN